MEASPLPDPKYGRSLTWGSGAMLQGKRSLCPLSPRLCPPPFPLGRTELMGTLVPFQSDVLMDHLLGGGQISDPHQ